MVYKKCIAVIFVLCFLIGTSAFCQPQSKEYYCKKAKQLERQVEQAKHRYDEYNSGRYRSQEMLDYYNNRFNEAQKEYDDFVQDSYREGAQPGWLRCQFD